MNPFPERLRRWTRQVTPVLAAAALVTVAPASSALAAPDRNVVAGAVIPAGTFDFAGRVTATCTRHVATTGNDANTGASASAAWKTPAKAVATLTAGQSACIHAGTYDVATLNPVNSGSAAAPIALIAAPGEARPVLRSSSDSPLINFGEGKGYWVVQGLDLNKNTRDQGAVQVLGSPASPAHHIAVRSNLIHGSKSGAAVLLRHGTRDVLVEGNDIYDNHRWLKNKDRSTASFTRLDATYRRWDANAINLESTPTGQVARVLVKGNHLHDNGGDGLQCLGVNDTQAHPQDAANLDILDNRIHHNTEDGLDIKSCQNVSIRGSRSPASPGAAADNKIYGLRATDLEADEPGNNSTGSAIILHYFARNVLIENTRIWDSCRGIDIGRGDDGVTNVVIRRNLVFGLVKGTRCSGYGLLVQLAQNLDVYHNTFTGIPSAALCLGRDNTYSTTSRDVDLFDNVIETTGTDPWIDWSTTKVPGLESNRNLFWAPDGSTSHFRIDGTNTTLATWRTNTGQDLLSRHGNPLWVADPATNDYYTQAGSPARDAALVTAGEPYCGPAPDLGFRESGC